MLGEILEKVYGIKSGEYLRLESFDAVRGNGFYYLIANPGGKDEEEAAELQKIAAHLSAYGDRNVPAVLPTQSGSIIGQWEAQKVCLLACRTPELQGNLKLGRKLAKFHERGKMVPFKVEKAARIGQWKSLWEARLDQMEKVWSERIFQPPADEFERLFVESFPYYAGLAENAIQYLVDTEIDAEPEATDNGTVCHERFTDQAWGRQYIIKNPMDWVFDHRSRDLADWVRYKYFRNRGTYGPEIARFFSEYGQITRLSPFSWRLLYARLLFPLHYLETVESYYSTTRESEQKMLEDRLVDMLKQTGDFETFVARFFALAGSPLQTALPKPEWLTR
ncbi:spore coat protein YutH [Neobacillus notoginsengisoli]|uniref:Spore coat protein YutH n=1 Tax=Neobacillus notoginsengisoli TaxID=1578198 RepID=A0A417YY32_9BACI|nr:spore coat protein YutH [Neobacillus notoginsengisoli]RHW42646.1 spore coat protein YutH [Neobacillus notoginsengisoli]